MEAIFLGVLTGLGMAISTGPVFLTLIQTSIDKGFKKSLFFISGVSLVDSTLVFGCWFGLNKIDTGIDQSILEVIAGFALIVFGLTFFKRKAPADVTSLEINEPAANGNDKKSKADGFVLFFKGVLINLLNPVVWAFWTGISQLSITSFSHSFDQATYIIGILATILGTDVLKGVFAQKLRPIFTSQLLNIFNAIIGLILIILGCKFLFGYYFTN